MTTYANGKAPESALVMVDGVHVVPTIADRVAAFLAYSAAAGQPQHIVALGGYCTLAEQKARQGVATGTIQVASVGNSTHGVYAIGRVDFVGANKRNYTAKDLAFQIAHCPSFGLVREFGNEDPNHWMQSGAWSAGPTTDDAAARRRKEDVMRVKGKADQVYTVYTDANGAERLRLAGLVEGQLAIASGTVIVMSDTQLTQLGAECGWVGGAITAPPLPKVQVDSKAGAVVGGTIELTGTLK